MDAVMIHAQSLSTVLCVTALLRKQNPPVTYAGAVTSLFIYFVNIFYDRVFMRWDENLTRTSMYMYKVLIHAVLSQTAEKQLATKMYMF